MLQKKKGGVQEDAGLLIVPVGPNDFGSGGRPLTKVPGKRAAGTSKDEQLGVLIEIDA